MWTLVSVGDTTAVTDLLRPPWESDFLFGRTYVFQGLVAVIVGGSNFLGDYLSLLETRHVLRWMARRRSPAALGIALLVDAVATFAIWAGFLLASISLVALAMAGGVGVEVEVGEAFVEMQHPRLWIENNPLGFGLLCAAYFTSFWLWAYVAGSLLLKGAHALGKGLSFLRRVLDIENKPLRSIGMVCNLGITAAFVIGMVL
jgi:hypothetical protein